MCDRPPGRPPGLYGPLVWVIFLALTVGRNRQGRLVPVWLRAASKSNLLWGAICFLGLLACALKLILL
jgi:hypothetical protein